MNTNEATGDDAKRKRKFSKMASGLSAGVNNKEIFVPILEDSCFDNDLIWRNDNLDTAVDVTDRHPACRTETVG